MEEQKSPFDGRTIFAILLCIGVWWGWQTYLEKKYPAAMKADHSAEQTQVPSGEGTKSVDSTQSNAATATTAPTGNAKVIEYQGPETTAIYSSGLLDVTFSSRGGRVTSIQLNKFKDLNQKTVSLFSDNAVGLLGFRAEGAGVPDFTNVGFEIKKLTDDTYEMVGAKDGLVVKKTVKVLPNDYTLDVRLELTGKADQVTRYSIEMAKAIPATTASSSSFLSPQGAGEIEEFFFSHGTKTDRLLISTDAIDKKFEKTGFAALGSRYFTSIFYNKTNVIPDAEGLTQNGVSILKFVYPVLEKKSAIVTQFRVYAGPKSVDSLARFHEETKQVIDYGMFSWIALQLLVLLKLFYSLFHNYGVAIIALTILVRIITFPFTYMSFKSMKAMQKIQPEMARVREIYKADQQKMNLEVMKLMKENKVNPMGGCLPILLQMPVFFALYQVLQNSIELYQVPFFLWITDLSAKDPYYVLPVLMGITMFIQQKMTPTTMDPAQAKVMLFMPVLFAFLMLGLPSGLTLYIFTNTLLGIVQQVFMMKDDKKTTPAVVRRA